MDRFNSKLNSKFNSKSKRSLTNQKISLRATVQIKAYNIHKFHLCINIEEKEQDPENTVRKSNTHLIKIPDKSIKRINRGNI